MECKVCHDNMERIFDSLILNKYKVSYYQCKHCGLILTEEPYWLDEAYSRPINYSDTGILQRNISLSKITAIIISNLFDKNAKFLDYAGGYGIFVRLMRDLGFDYYWSDKYSSNLFANGFEFHNQKVDMISAFEVFEHFVNPLEDIKGLLGSMDADLLFSTDIYGQELELRPQDWWYYGYQHGQHVSFYSRRTLDYIARQIGMNYYFISEGIHLFTRKRISKGKVAALTLLLKLVNRRVLSYGLKSRTVDDMLLASKLDGKTK